MAEKKNPQVRWIYQEKQWALSIQQNFKIPVLKFRKFHVPNGMVHFGCTDLTQATVCLVIVLHLQAGYKRAVLGTTLLSNGNGHFGRPTRPLKEDHKMVPNIPVGPNQNGPFHLMYQTKLREFWVEWKRPALKPNFSYIVFCYRPRVG